MHEQTQFRVILRPKTITRSSSGQISGVLFIEFDQYAFPEPEWSDLVVATLSMWSESINAFLDNPINEAELRFVDGPFLARISASERNYVNVALIEATHTETVEKRGMVATIVALEALAAAIDELLGVCSSNLWWSPDIDHLIASREALELHERRLRNRSD